MVKKCAFILFFFISYLSAVLPSFAEFDNKENEEQSNIDTTKKLQEWKEIDKEGVLDPFKMHQEQESTDSDLDCTKNIRYTVAQKKRLDQIYHRIYMDYIDLIETYAWGGAMTQDQKLIRYKMLRNYILTFQKRNYKWCSEYEEDEWEEEWFNSDND
ncbi:DUF2680 domain-containing protein [Neobacillus sp. NPDC093127]|uniref:DUF2680 domain-containing protein n=1 Tax=Neobacillus sp. NPDC093127 TaxID=3364296 RepID=UPI00380CFB3E